MNNTNMQNVFSFETQYVEEVSLNDEIEADFKTSARTAIYRSGVSAPLKVLIESGMLKTGSTLHFGKGKANHDTEALIQNTGHCVEYDYVYQPKIDVLGNCYDNVFMGYVVNTLPPSARKYVYQTVLKCTKGIAFIAARTDRINGEPSEDGVITSIGTFQKSYGKGELAEEAKQYFKHVVELKGKSGFSLVACYN